MALFACYTGSNDIAATDTAAAHAAASATATTNGLPCSVADVLSRSCLSCHGSPPTGGAANSMLTYEDLTAASASDPSKTEAALAVARMEDTSKPMPPSGPAPSSDTDALTAWIDAGAPRGTCATAPTTGSAPGPSVCISGKTWTRGDRGSSSMHPGQACIACHESGRGPEYTIAGTLFPTGHEPDDCNGFGQAGVTVTVTDASGRSVELTPNSAGNFYSRSGLTPPYQVKVVSGSSVRAMNGSVTSGDCNSCHTKDGAQGAPGRVMTP
jgi:hypothetical protein